MNRITTLSLAALLAVATLAGTGCQRREDGTPPTGAGPGTTTTTPGTTSGDAGSMGSTSPAMPPASAASQ